ncbi:MAG: hypothetical protein HY359_09675 [Candidatus Rokubacteria bacterium]|nr:hypothetical protein [Candidatus Rokubacteria bacterium]
MTARPGAAEVLLFFVLPLAVVSLTMVCHEADEQPMSRREIEELTARSRMAARSGSRGVYRIRGMAVGSQAEDRASFAEVKAAWRARASRWSARWRRMFLMGLGGLLMLVGGFGAMVVAAPPGIKLLFGGALGYALVRLVWGFRRA